MTPTNIYALIDPRTDEIRYVGKTIKTVEARVSVHLYYARKGVHTACARWLKSLIDIGLKPEIKILEIVHEDWAKAECYWIAKFKSEGIPLLNHTAGGDGLNEYRHKPEAVAKIKAALATRYENKPNPLKGRPRTEEVRLKCSISQKGRIVSQEKRDRISATMMGRVLPEEVRMKISASLKGRPKPPRTDEHCERIAEKARGRVRSEETKAAVSAKLKAYAATPEGRAKLLYANAIRYGRVN